MCLLTETIRHAEKWTPLVGQRGNQIEVDSAVHVQATEVSGRFPA